MTFTVKAGSVLPDDRPINAKRKYPFDTLVVDGAFFVPGKTTKQLASYVSLMGRKLTAERGALVKFATKRGVMQQEAETGAWVPCGADGEGVAGVVVRRVA